MKLLTELEPSGGCRTETFVVSKWTLKQEILHKSDVSPVEIENSVEGG
jgi:hypothetical protein